MTSSLRISVPVVLGLLLSSTGLRAQWAATSLSSEMSGVIPTPVALTWLPGSQRQTDVPHRSPAAAWALSFLIPVGVGNFYAGNPVLGTVHVVVGGASAALLYANLGCFGDPCDSETGALIGFVGFTANWIVGQITSVASANAFNRRAVATSGEAARVDPVLGAEGVGFRVTLKF